MVVNIVSHYYDGKPSRRVYIPNVHETEVRHDTVALFVNGVGWVTIPNDRLIFYTHPDFDLSEYTKSEVVKKPTAEVLCKKLNISTT